MFGQTGALGSVDGVPASALVFLRALDQHRHKLLTDSGLTLSELRFLARVAEQHQTAPTVLASSLNLTTGAVTAISDRLVERDLIRRVTHPSDRRAVVLELTRSGELLMAEIYDDFRGRVAAVAGQLTRDDADMLTGMLYKLAGSFGYELEDGLAGSQTAHPL